tara:strand:+ start:276 stop:1037 length:762 start_codon:yes stop_codon:yes gene_type:complete
MSDFNYQAYLKNNPLLQEEAKGQLITESQEIDETVEDSVSEGFLDFLKKKKEAAPVKKEDPNPIIGVDYDGNYIRKDGTMAESMNEGFLDFLKKKKEEAPVKKEDPNPIIGVDYDGNYIRKDGTMAESQEIEETVDEIEETVDEIKEEAPSSKIKVSELKAKIKENILATLSEEDEEDGEEDIEVEDEVEVDIEEPSIDAAPSDSAGLSSDEQEIQNSLKLAYDNAVAIGDQKLADQIGNSITFFTRTHVVER